MFNQLKQKWHEFEAKYFDINSPEEMVFKAIVTPDYLAGEVNGKEYARIRWQDIEVVAINIEGDFEPFPYWYIGHEQQGVRLPQDAVNMEAVLVALVEYLPHFNSKTTRDEINVALQAAEGRYYIWQR